MIKRLPLKIVVYTILIALSLIIIFPIYVTFVTAFKTAEESSSNFFSLPIHLYLGNFKEVMSDSNFLHYVGNSLLITVVSILIISIMIPLVSYAIARNMKYHKYYAFLYILFVLSVFAPFQVIMIPLTQICTKLHIMNQFGMI
jgi:raffinose/stachyose/melibiose transport system permease protein